MNTPPPRLTSEASHIPPHGAEPAYTQPPGVRTQAAPGAPEALRERRMNLARLALASGTGEDIAALAPAGRRGRLRLEGGALRALALLLALVLATSWAYIAWEGKAHAGESAAQSTSQAAGTGGAAGEDSRTHSTPSELAPQGAPVDSEAEPSGQIVIYISGAVANPGVYTLEETSRVNDGVTRAGGLREDADSVAINLAAPLADGEHLHIPASGEEMPASLQSAEAAGGEASSGGQAGLLNLNTASATELESLPGIGPATASSIVQWREENGRFTSPEDLLEISGIGNAKYAKLRSLVTAE